MDPALGQNSGNAVSGQRAELSRFSGGYVSLFRVLANAAQVQAMRSEGEKYHTEATGDDTRLAVLDPPLLHVFRALIWE